MGYALSPEDREPELSAEASCLIGIFVDLSQRRGNNGFGPSPLNHADFKQWQKRHREKLPHWLRDILYALDDIYMHEYHQAQSVKK